MNFHKSKKNALVNFHVNAEHEKGTQHKSQTFKKYFKINTKTKQSKQKVFCVMCNLFQPGVENSVKLALYTAICNLAGLGPRN